ncbi:MAG TPA: MFS transporter [Dehalococcoidia bacterium]|nr:MFS transporter [Dehalococcoidia bacterium]
MDDYQPGPHSDQRFTDLLTLASTKEVSTGTRPRVFLGWYVVAAAALAAFGEVAFFNPVLGVFIPEFESEFGWSRTEISAGVTLGSLVSAAIAPFFGPLVDRYGGRRFVVGGSLLMCVGLVCLSQMQTEWQFFILYALGRGTASGLIGLAGSVTVSKWFVRRRGFAVGVMSLGSRAGFAVLPIGVQLIIEASSWRTAALSLAAFVILVAVIPSLRWLHSRPEDFGLLPDGAPVPPPSGLLVPQPMREVSWTRHDAVRTSAFWLVTAAVALQSWAGGAINLHQIPHLVDSGLSAESAALTVSLLAVFAAAGAFLEGFLDSSLGSRWTFIIGLLGSSVGMVILMNVHSIETAMAFAFVYGLSWGLQVTSSQIVFADYFGRESLGAIRGSSVPFQMGLNAIGPLVAGGAYDLTGSYLAAFIPFTIAYLLAVGALLLARKPALPETLPASAA